MGGKAKDAFNREEYLKAAEYGAGSVATGILSGIGAMATIAPPVDKAIDATRVGVRKLTGLLDGGSQRLYRGLENKYDPLYKNARTDAPSGYSTWTDNPDLARQYAGDSGYVYSIDLPKSEIRDEILDQTGERALYFNNQKRAGLNNISGDEYLIYQDHEAFNPEQIKLRKAESKGLLGQGERYNTPEFKNWFGDSKVVDEGGKPLTAYKGMYPYDYTQEVGDYKGPLVDRIERPSEFPAFNKGEKGVKISGFFSSKPDVASKFVGDQGAVYPVNLSIKNPYIIDAKGEHAAHSQFYTTGKPFRDAIRSGKYDGVIIKNTKDEGDVFVTLKPQQSKSIHNQGSYDPKDPRMLKSLAPLGIGAALGANALSQQKQEQQKGLLY